MGDTCQGKKAKHRHRYKYKYKSQDVNTKWYIFEVFLLLEQNCSQEEVSCCSLLLPGDEIFI